MSVGIKVLDCEDDYLGRNVRLNANNKAVQGFQISRRSNRTKYDRVVFEKSEDVAISEYSISIDHSKLDEIASDNDSYKSYTSSKFPRIKSGKDLNMIIFQVDERREFLTDEDIETLAYLLQIQGNDIIVPPFVRTSKKAFDADRYIHMTSVLRDCLGPNCNIACSIPEQASKKDIPRIMDAMDTSSQIYVKDFNGKKVLDTVNDMQLRTILRRIRDIEKEHSEGSFIYAYDSRLSPKNGSNKDFAEGQITSAIGLNAVGPKRKHEPLPSYVLEKMSDSNPYESQRLFNAEDYRIYSIASGRITSRFSDFVWDNYGCDYLEMKMEDLRNLVFAFNHSERSKDVHNIDMAIADNDLKQYIQNKDAPDSTMKYLEKVSKKVNSSDR